MQLPIKGLSAWKFNSFGGASVGAGIMGSGGQIEIYDTKGTLQTFTYGGIGGGASVGAKSPPGKLLSKIMMKLKLPAGLSGSGAPLSFPSTGTVLVTANCPGSDLTVNDFRGICVFIEAGAGLIAGGSGMLMFAGCQPPTGWWQQAAYNAASAMPGGQITAAMFMARAVIPMAGVNVGPQASAGIAGYYGAMY